MNTTDTFDYLSPPQVDPLQDLFIKDLFDEEGAFDESDCAGI